MVFSGQNNHSYSVTAATQTTRSDGAGKISLNSFLITTKELEFVSSSATTAEITLPFTRPCFFFLSLIQNLPVDESIWMAFLETETKWGKSSQKEVFWQWEEIARCTGGAQIGGQQLFQDKHRKNVRRSISDFPGSQLLTDRSNWFLPPQYLCVLSLSFIYTSREGGRKKSTRQRRKGA